MFLFSYCTAQILRDIYEGEFKWRELRREAQIYEGEFKVFKSLDILDINVTHAWTNINWIQTSNQIIYIEHM